MVHPNYLNILIQTVHISTIQGGDTVRHNGIILTVCNADIKHGCFMGSTLFGDSYKLGTILVEKVTFTTKK